MSERVRGRMGRADGSGGILREPAYTLGAGVLVASLATIIAALAFEHIGGYAPCPLCLQQRYAYYAGIPATFAALALFAAGRAKASAWIMLAVALGFLVNAGVGVYHAGFEWGFWPGPTTCDAAAAQPIATNPQDLLKSLQSTRIARCDAPSWRFLGLSFAGWNALISLVLCIGALKACFAAIALPWDRAAAR